MGAARVYSGFMWYNLKWPLLAVRHLKLGNGVRSLSKSGITLKGKKSTLVTQGDQITGFSRSDFNNFSNLRTAKGVAYFDRTKYISALDNPVNNTILFLRPRRFGKSLTLSMLECFHGIQYQEQYKILFKGLDVHRDVRLKNVTPNEYLILKFDFSKVKHSLDINLASQQLTNHIVRSLKEFCLTYSHYFGKSYNGMVAENINEADEVSSLDSLVCLVNKTMQDIKWRGELNRPLAGAKGIYILVDEYDAFTNQYMNPYGNTDWEQTPIATLIKTFWATVKSLKGLEFGVRKCFITGISPVSLVDVGSGFNIATNVSFDEDFTGLCGLSRADVQHALNMLCNNDTSKVEEHLNTLTNFVNGYHFCHYKVVEPVFNTNTCLEYLQSVLSKSPSNIINPPNSEVSERFLKICAYSPAAVSAMEAALSPPILSPESPNSPPIFPLLTSLPTAHLLPTSPPQYKLIPYSQLAHQFSVMDLRCDQFHDRSDIWYSLLLYFGGFTFDKKNPSQYLTIPNYIAARRFRIALLDRFNLLGKMGNAIRFLASSGDIKRTLGGYLELMTKRDVYDKGYTMNEQEHRDSFYAYTRINSHLYSEPEYQITTQRGHLGFVDLIISMPTHFIITEWKTINIDFLDAGVSLLRSQKADLIAGLDVEGVLGLKFNWKEKFKKGTIRDWITNEVTAQLRKYVESKEVKEQTKGRQFHAHLVLVVGSRQILIWDMDQKGNWIGEPELAPNHNQAVIQG